MEFGGQDAVFTAVADLSATGIAATFRWPRNLIAVRFEFRRGEQCLNTF